MPFCSGARRYDWTFALVAVTVRLVPGEPKEVVVVRTVEDLGLLLFLVLLLVGIAFHLLDLLFLLAFVFVPAVALFWFLWRAYQVRQAGRFLRTFADEIRHANNYLRAPPDILHYDIRIDRLVRQVKNYKLTSTQRALVRLSWEIKAIGLNERFRVFLEKDSDVCGQIRETNRRILAAVEDQDRYALFCELGWLYSLYVRRSLAEAEEVGPPDTDSAQSEMDGRVVATLKAVATQIYEGRPLGSLSRIRTVSRDLIVTNPTRRSCFSTLLLFWARSKLLQLPQILSEQSPSSIWAMQNERLGRLIYAAAVAYEQGDLDQAVEVICQSYDQAHRALRFLTPPPGRTVLAQMRHTLRRAPIIR